MGCALFLKTAQKKAWQLPVAASRLSWGGRVDDSEGSERPPVRSLVGIITTIATVIHLTFGCCLHPCHFGGHGDAATPSVGLVTAEACCHDHLPDDVLIQRATDPSGHGAEVDRITLSASEACADCDACHGCQCAALSAEPLPIPSWSPLASGILAAVDGAAIANSQAKSGQPPPDCHPRSGRPALFERLLI